MNNEIDTQYIDCISQLPNHWLIGMFSQYCESFKIKEEWHKKYCYEPLEREVLRRMIACT